MTSKVMASKRKKKDQQSTEREKDSETISSLWQVSGDMDRISVLRVTDLTVTLCKGKQRESEGERKREKIFEKAKDATD